MCNCGSLSPPPPLPLAAVGGEKALRDAAVMPLGTVREERRRGRTTWR